MNDVPTTEHRVFSTSGQGTAQRPPFDYTDMLLGDQQEDDVFWKVSGVKIEEILGEVDCMIALAEKKEQTSIAQYRAGIHRQLNVVDHTKTLNMAVVGSPSKSHGGVILRRPRDEDEYWSISPRAWLHTSNPRQMVLSNVGRINETSEGEEAPYGDCTACSRSGAECMVYRRESVIQKDDKAGQACSRCRFRGLKCSFDTRKIDRGSKRKGGTGGIDKREQNQKTRTLRRSKSTGIAR